jgi:hypothetical protein
MKRWLVSAGICVGLLGLVLASRSPAAETDAAKVKAATAAATAWLAIVDAGKYADSYKKASSFFQEKITEAKWVEALTGVRKPLGALVSRKVKAAKYATSLPGAPAGEYVVIVFDTSFKEKKGALETVTPMLDKDKKWHVSGYFIK